jgi:hypothetical protein
MTARSSYESSCKSADTARVQSDIANVNAFQETISAQQGNVGFGGYYSNNASLVTATKNANAALLAARVAETAAKMASLDAARETLRATGDLAPL